MKKVSLLILITLFSLNAYANTVEPINPDPNDPIGSEEIVHFIVSHHATVCTQYFDDGTAKCGALFLPELVDIRLVEDEYGHKEGVWVAFAELEETRVVFTIKVFLGFGVQSLEAKISYDDGKNMVRSIAYPENFSSFNTIDLDANFDVPNDPTIYHWLSLMVSPAPLPIKP